MSHTPGPWWVGDKDDFDGIAVLYHEDKVPVANVPTGSTDRNGMANARLIASAPDLLAALERMLSEFGFLASEVGATRGEAHAVEAARAAIAKAKP